ncbi:glycosyltransferase [Roseococcus sp. DSY-14]|uniref:glycosyltransferase n=1 Tax=Roseococcus sp. DSY-14 TaxID=3369650 RepID=UPI00387AB142
MRLLLDLQGAQGGARRGGLGRYTLELARALLRHPRGHDPLVLVNTGLAGSAAELLAEFGPAQSVRWTAPAGTAAGRAPQHALRRAAALLRAEAVLAAQPDALHLGSIFEGWDTDAVTTWPAERGRVATAATLHDLLPLSLRPLYLDGLWGANGLRPWYAACLAEAAACDLLLCNSEHTRGEARRFLPQPPERVAVIGGAPAARFRPPEPGAASPHPGCVLFLGAGDPRKDDATLVRGFALLPPALRRRHPLCIGHADPAGLRARFAAAGLAEGEAVALPFVPDDALPALYAGAALVVIPSLGEGYGLPAAEAMACGAPVLVARAGALPELAPRPDAQFPPGDAPALATLLRRWLEDPEGRAELAAHGLRRAREWSWDGVAARAWDALEALAPRRAPPRRLPRLALLAERPDAALAGALAADYAVTLCGPAPPEDEALAARFPFLDQARLPARARLFDRVLAVAGEAPPLAVLGAVPAVVLLRAEGAATGEVLEAARAVLVPDAAAADRLRAAHGAAATFHLHVLDAAGLPAAIEAGWARPLPEEVLAGLGLDAAGAAAAAPALARSLAERGGAGPRVPRLWLDLSLLPRPQVAALLRDGVPGRRVAALRPLGDRPWTDHAGTWALLDRPGAPPPEEEAATLPGDVLLTEDPALRRLAPAWGLRLGEWRGDAAALRAACP